MLETILSKSLYVFFFQVLTEAELSNKLPDLKAHFCEKVLTCASRLQCANASQCSSELPVSLRFSPDSFGEELLRCLENLPAAQVNSDECNAITPLIYVRFVYLHIDSDILSCQYIT